MSSSIMMPLVALALLASEWTDAAAQGDRAQVVFADPAEISTFIRKECPQ